MSKADKLDNDEIEDTLDVGDELDGQSEEKDAKLNNQDNDVDVVESDEIEVKPQEKRLAKKRRPRHRDRSYVRELESTATEAFRQIDELKQRLSATETGVVATAMSTIDGNINEANGYYNRAKQVYAEAVKNGDGEAAAQALETMAEAREAMNALKYQKQQREDAFKKDRETREAPQPQTKTIHPKVKQYSTEWLADNPWYDPAQKDANSRIAFAIDQTLVAEGYDPRTKDYWEELNTRLAANPRLAKLVNSNNDEDDDDDDDEDETPRRREARSKPVTSKVSQVNSNSRAPGKIVISKARADAMRQMGLEPGTPDWSKMAKRYAAYDKANATRN